jgi:hypothetical protein
MFAHFLRSIADHVPWQMLLTLVPDKEEKAGWSAFLKQLKANR